MSNFKSNNVAKISLVAVEGLKIEVAAHYNPAEIQLEQATTWNSDPTNTMKTHTKSQGRAVSMELFFDVAETARANGAQRKVDGDTLTNIIEQLTMLGLPKSDEGKDDERRPPTLRLANGPFPNMTCVMESVSFKITRFDELYRPTRATASVKLRELTNPQMKAAMGKRVHAEREGWIAPTAETEDERAERVQRITSFDEDRK